MSGLERSARPRYRSVEEVARVVEALLGNLDARGGLLAGLHAKHFLATSFAERLRGIMDFTSPAVVYRDGCVIRIHDCAPALGEEIVQRLRPLDFARGEDGTAAFLFFSGTEERLAELREVYRRERRRSGTKPGDR
jgi:hypothetical protein